MRAGNTVADASKQVRAEFSAIRNVAIDKHSNLIRDLNTVIVAAQLEAAVAVMVCSSNVRSAAILLKNSFCREPEKI